MSLVCQFAFLTVHRSKGSCRLNIGPNLYNQHTTETQTSRDFDKTCAFKGILVGDHGFEPRTFRV